VIWRNGTRQIAVILYVGRGTLRRELADCRRDPLFRGEPGLKVTWARVEPGEVDGVTAYLCEPGERLASLQISAASLGSAARFRASFEPPPRPATVSRRQGLKRQESRPTFRPFNA